MELPNGHAIWKVVNGIFPSNTYICAIDVPGECILIDPGLDCEVIERELLARNLKPRYQYCTHGHFDHLGSAAFFQEKYGAKVFLHEADMKTAKAANFLLMAFKVAHRLTLPRFDVMGDDFSMTVGGKELRCITVAGHTPGSCVFQYGMAIFSGDSLYSSGVGLSGLPGENLEQLKKSLLSLRHYLPQDSTIYPGHGEPATFSWVCQNNHKLRKFLGCPDYRPEESGDI